MSQSTESPKGMDTKEKLVAAASGLFSERWYGTVSVAEICRRAGLSNGVFYKYFQNKEELFKLILGTVADRIGAAIADIPGTTAARKITTFAESLLDFTRENPGPVSVFREGQYRFFEYEQKLAHIYTEALSRALEREAGLPEYLFALGGLRFCAIRAAFGLAPVDRESVFSILKNGIFKGESFDPDRVFRANISPLPINVAPDARERLLVEGKNLFGRKGFFETNIHEVTDAAGLSVGAFYTYFGSKEIFYAELIDRVGREVRHFISLNMGRGLGRLERELRGMWLFTILLSIDKNCYNIVREAEFVLPEKAKAYYQAFVAGYQRNPEGNGKGDQRTAIEFLLGVAHYLGIMVAFDASPANARAVVEAIGDYLVKGLVPESAMP